MKLRIWLTLLASLLGGALLTSALAGRGSPQGGFLPRICPVPGLSTDQPGAAESRQGPETGC
jgi:hypothetical protein